VVFSELPVAFDAITVVVPAGNTWLRSLSLAQLARLWGPAAQGKVTHWNQIDPAWPKRRIKLCGPGKDSGTFDYFNEVVNGSSSKSRMDYTASEDDAVLVKCVASHPDALGYFGFSYYASNRSRLRAVPLSTSGGKAVAPSLASVQNGSYRPLSRLLFVYVNDAEMRRRDLVRQLVTSLLRQAPQIAKAEGVIPLSKDTYRLIETKFYRHVLGTSFSGTLPVGMTIDQALQKSLESVRRPEYR
jgi:phosphate transport system substrate-binding protein